MKNKLFNWFMSTWLGGLYFDFLLWLDRRADKVKFLTPKERATITRNYSMLWKGVTKMKTEINQLLNARTAEEYDQYLKTVENMLQFTDRAEDSPEAKLAQYLRSMKVKKGNKDIVTHTDHAKMVQGRIEDYRELQAHVVKRQLMRKIRKAKQSGDTKLLEQLEKEWKEKYANRR